MSDFSPNSAAVITHNVVPLRAAPDGGSEQTSQAILGDAVTVLDERDDYVRVRMADDYEGWIWREHLRPLEAEPNRTAPFHYVSVGLTDLLALPQAPETLITKMVLGTRFRVIEGASGERQGVNQANPPMLRVEVPFCRTGGGAALTTGYVAASAALPATSQGYQGDFSGAAACALAARFIGTPYLWGGTTPFGFDCSGFVQRIYSLLNVPLPRDAYVQARSPLGAAVAPEQTLRAGDLLFFCGRSDPHRRGITHVGMALDADRFIHAYGRRGVVVARRDDPECRAAYTFVSAWRYGANA